jgi:hypothetical protein
MERHLRQAVAPLLPGAGLQDESDKLLDIHRS